MQLWKKKKKQGGRIPARIVCLSSIIANCLQIIHRPRDKLKSPIGGRDHPVEPMFALLYEAHGRGGSVLVKISRAHTHTHLLFLCVDHGGETNTWLPLSEQVTLCVCPPAWPFDRGHHPPRRRSAGVQGGARACPRFQRVARNLYSFVRQPLPVTISFRDISNAINPARRTRKLARVVIGDYR